MKWVIVSTADDTGQKLWFTGTDWSGIKVMAKTYYNEDAANLGVQVLRGLDAVCNRASIEPFNVTATEKEDTSE